jgi:hypothetical protein
MSYTEPNKSDAVWDHDEYRITIGYLDGEKCSMVNVLGRVKKKNDGRWEWTRKYVTNFCPNGWANEHKQGVADTKEEAMKKVEEGFNVA